MNDFPDGLQDALGHSLRLERELGGGMSRVYLVRDLELGRQVVVKVLPPGMAGAVSRDRFRLEIQLAARLQHPHLVPLLGAGSADDFLWYTMPYVEGETLRERLAREGALPMPDVIRVLTELAEVLRYAHGLGIVHRDLKPENVLLTRGHALLADLGVAKALGSSRAPADEALTSEGVALGTPAYMAPEQWMAEPTLDHRVDLYALGVIGYELLTGAAPFAGRRGPSLRAAHLTEPPVPVTVVRAATPPGLASLVARCLEKHPADRPASADEVIAALSSLPREVDHSEAVPVRVPSRVGPRVLGTLVLAGLAALGSWAVWRWWPGTRPDPGVPWAAVAPFENRTGDPALDNLGEAAVQWLTQGLVASGLVDVVDLQTLLGTLGDDAPITPDATRRARVARATGFVVQGSYGREGDSLRFVARITDPESGRVLRVIDGVGAASGAVSAILEALRDRVAGGVALLLDSTTAWASGAPPTRAPTLAAYLEFVQGREADASGRDGAVEEHFRRSLAADPGFTAVAIELAWFLLVRGDTVAVDSLLREVTSNPLALESRELIQVEQLRAARRWDLVGELSAQRRLAALAPGSERVRINLLFLLAQASRCDEAIRFGDSLPTWRNHYWAILAWDLLLLCEHRLDRVKEELRRLERFRALAPSEVAGNQLTIRVLPRALARQGRHEEALRVGLELADSLSYADLGGYRLSLHLLQMAWEIRRHAGPDVGRSAAAAILDWLDRHPTGDELHFRLVTRFQLRVLLADTAGANVLADSLWDLQVRTGERHFAGPWVVSSLAALGPVPEPTREKWIGRWPSADPLYRYGLARTAAIEGRRDEALELLQQVRRRDGRGEFLVYGHSDWAFESLRGYPAFERLLGGMD